MEVESDRAAAWADERVIFERILVPTDGSSAARAGGTVAIGLAHAYRGRIRFVLVLDPARIVSDLAMGIGRDVFDRVLESAAGWRADVIVAGTHARAHSFLPTLGGKTHEMLSASSHRRRWPHLG